MRIGFWGPFGTRNLGNECTLHAMLDGARRHRASAELVGVCLEPSDTTSRHQVAALPISVEPAPSFLPLPGPLRKLRRPLWELTDWVRVLRAARGLDMLVVTGTGIITDKHDGKLGAPYQMFKWVVATRLAGHKVSFVSVGAEELSHPVQLFFLRWSLRLAEYRSYRDPITRQRAEGLLKDAGRDPLYPDLAFSLPKELSSLPQKQPGSPKTVAVGIYAVEMDEAGAAAYVETIGRFVLWLLERGYRTRLVHGDANYDGPMRDRLHAWLRAHDALARVVDEYATSFEELLPQLADADLVVATRFHNLLLAVFLGKPVISLSHMDKNDALMQMLGLSAYCRGLEGLELDHITGMFQELEQHADEIRATLRHQLDLFRNQLEEQYASLFGRLSD